MSADTAFPGRVAVMGGGSWATALAKLLLTNRDRIIWYMRRQDRIDEFRRCGHNPVYLSDIPFDTNRIDFTADINRAVTDADTLVLVMPSPYFKSHMEKVTVPLAHKSVVSAIKGIVPGDNKIVSDYMVSTYGVDPERMLAVSGPCHAEEIALGRRSFLTVACRNAHHAAEWVKCLSTEKVSAVTSPDIDGIEYAAVLKNIYAIVAGIIHGMKAGDNFLAVMVSNAIREMEQFLTAVCPANRNICNSVYLGDLLVTAYSRFSRNHNFGSMIGKGYSVKAARMEMEQTAEGYFGSQCIHEINQSVGAHMPIAEGLYDILYGGYHPEAALRAMADTFN